MTGVSHGEESPVRSPLDRVDARYNEGNVLVNGLSALSAMRKLTVGGLLVAAVGVVIQIASGVSYPAVPPVFFILLVPVALIAFGGWRWTPLVATLGGLFLIVGLFGSGAAARLADTGRPGGVGGSLGLWVQMLGVVVATVTGVVAALQSYTPRSPAVVGSGGR